MKLNNLMLYGGIVLALFAGSSVALAAEHDIIIAAPAVKQFIDRIHLTERVEDNSDILIARGHAIRWPDAFAGETITRDINNSQTITKIFVIPFTQIQGSDITASIIGGIIEYENGARTQEFIEMIDLSGKPAISVADAPISNIRETGSSTIFASAISQLISAGNRRAIFERIIHTISYGQIDDVHLAILIRNGFQANGYSCGITPGSFPQASIWYAATCIRSIP